MRARRTPSSTAAVVALAFLALLGTGTHTVERGETLSGIAARYGTTSGALARANGLADPNRLQAGVSLVVPTKASLVRSAMPSYTVRRGDRLERIAATHGTTVVALLAANDLINPDLIRIGQVLVLPARTRTTTPTAPSSGGAPRTPIAPAGGATGHLVRVGDTIGRIARTYRIPQAQLIDANGLTDQRIYVGQRLRLVPLPGSGTAAGESAPVTHRVGRGVRRCRTSPTGTA